MQLRSKTVSEILHFFKFFSFLMDQQQVALSKLKANSDSQ